MHLTKRIPARTETIKAEWCQKNFMAMSQRFRDVRAKSRNRMESCHWCRYEFADGDMMALACFGKIGNRTLCQACADELLASETAT